MIWLLIPLLPIIGYFFIWLVKYLEAYKYLKSIPAPTIYPIIGNALEFKSTTNVLDKFMYMFDKYNTKILRLNLGPRNALIIKDYKFLEFLLSSTKIINKSHGYTFVEPWLGTGLLTSGGDKWRKRRKMITPSFHFQILDQFVEVFHSNSDILVKKLKKEVGKGSTDIYPYITLCALDIVCETAMGTSVNAQMSAESDYVKSVKDMCRIIFERSFSPLYHYNFLYQFSKLYQDQTQALNVLHGYTDSVIKKRREEVNQKMASPQVDDVGVKKRIAFLDMLLQASIDNQPLSDADIREEVDTFMFEGHDTTASAMSFALFCLANNPEVQQKAYEEIKLIFDDDMHRPATHKDLQDMKYLEMVLKETLRLYPSVPMYVRQVREECKYNELTLPKDLALNIFAYGIHRDPEYFPDPEKFDPERFSFENQQGKMPYSFIAFSAGPRNCIGQKYALLEMKSTLSKVLRNFELKPVIPAHKLQLCAETVLKSSNGVLIRIEERNTKK